MFCPLSDTGLYALSVLPLGTALGASCLCFWGMESCTAASCGFPNEAAVSAGSWPCAVEHPFRRKLWHWSRSPSWERGCVKLRASSGFRLHFQVLTAKVGEPSYRPQCSHTQRQAPAGKSGPSSLPFLYGGEQVQQCQCPSRR